MIFLSFNINKGEEVFHPYYFHCTTTTMENLIGKIVRIKEQSSSSRAPSRFSKVCCDNVYRNNDDIIHNSTHEIKKGYVPFIVGLYEEEEERFIVPVGWMNHVCIVSLLQLSANEFGYHQQGVIHIPCEPHHFRLVMEHIASN